jgi:hypothetical protein
MRLGRFLTFGGGFGWGMGIILIELSIWDVFGYARGRDEAGKRFATCSRSRAFPIREGVPVGLGFWLLGAFGRGFRWEQDVFGVYYTNKNLYCPFCSYWRTGWDGCRRGILDDGCLALVFIVGGIGDRIKVYLGFITLIKHYPTHFITIGGGDGMDAGGGQLDDVVYK